MFLVRTLYYQVLHRLSDVTLIQHATGFGLFDRVFVDMVRALEDPYPYTRGLIAEFGFGLATIFGFALSALSLLVAIGYFVYKLIFWNSFPVGIAPMVIGLFLSFSVQ